MDENLKRAAEQYERWLSVIPDGDPLKEELLTIREKPDAIRERFYQEITFGTAGLRGISGAGTNRMNRFTVGRATQGIADYILAEDAAHPERKREETGAFRGVVLAYDCRYHSKEFAVLAAEILNGNGIRTFLFPSMRTTPELSFAIRRLGAISGINMTASHNPKEYNGYKVYWQDGAQINGSVGDGMQSAIVRHDLFEPFPHMDAAEAKAAGLYLEAGQDIDEAYLSYVLSMQQRPDSALDLTVPIVYTPLNGAGAIPMREVMKARGFTDFAIVKEQAEPDPAFTTVGYPNPEDPKAFAFAEKLGQRNGAEVLIATDPDGDRMAVEIAEKTAAAKDVPGSRSDIAGNRVPAEDKTGIQYRFLNGNQTGALLIDYLASSQKAAGKLPANAAMIKSIVTGDLGRAICESYGIRVFEALTGFKNICGTIPQIERQGYTCFFAYEESIGCAPGAAVRDKDGVTAGMLVAEMAAYYRKKGKTLGDALDTLYRKYGYYAEDQVSLVLTGAEGSARIRRIMDAFRKEKPGHFGAFVVQTVTDYLHGAGEIPASNVLKFDLGNGTWFAMRPSGTEPKLKFYYYAVAEDGAASRETVQALETAVQKLVESVK